MLNNRNRLLLAFMSTFFLFTLILVNCTIINAQYPLSFFTGQSTTQGFWGTTPYQPTYNMSAYNMYPYNMPAQSSFFGTPTQQYQYNYPAQSFVPNQGYNASTYSFFNPSGTTTGASSSTNFFGYPTGQSFFPNQANMYASPYAYTGMTPFRAAALNPYAANPYGAVMSPFGGLLGPVPTMTPYGMMPMNPYGMMNMNPYGMPMNPYGMPMNPYGMPMNPYIYNNPYGFFNPAYGTNTPNQPYYPDYDPNQYNPPGSEEPAVPKLEGYWVGDWKRLDPNTHEAIAEGQLRMQITSVNMTSGVVAGKILDVSGWEFEFDPNQGLSISGTVNPYSNNFIIAKFFGMDGYIYNWNFDMTTVTENSLKGTFNLIGYNFNRTYVLQMSPYQPS